MNDLNQKLLEINEKIVKTFTEISSIKPHAWHVFFGKQYKTHEETLLSYRKEFNEIDREIEPHTIIPGDYNGIQMASGKLSMLFSTRNMALISLGEAQNQLFTTQSQASFKFTTSVSLLAIIIAAFGTAC